MAFENLFHRVDSRCLFSRVDSNEVALTYPTEDEKESDLPHANFLIFDYWVLMMKYGLEVQKTHQRHVNRKHNSREPSDLNYKLPSQAP